MRYSNVPKPGSYTFTLETKLLVQFKAAKIDFKEAVLFFGGTIKAMQQSPANYGPHKDTTVKKYMHPTWLMRGYYPGSTIYFRITMIKVDNNPSAEYVAKVIVPSVHPAIRHSFFNGEEIDKLLEQRAERVLLGEEVVLEELKSQKINLPKCISPVGMPKYGLKE
jgi:hypothetical protein